MEAMNITKNSRRIGKRNTAKDKLTASELGGLKCGKMSLLIDCFIK
jgi:hypothetical protein